MRVRKNAAEMTDTEWTRFCKAVVALKHTFPAGQSEESKISVYDQFVAQHRGVRTLSGARDGGHGGPAFLPWHREYLRRFEAALMAVDPRVTLPYWNWGLGDDPETVNDSETDALFGNDRLGPREGETGTGAITSGYFSKAGRNELGWTIHPSLRISTEDTLQRGESWSMPSMDVLSTLALTSYPEFHPALERIHGTVHNRVGGHMSDREISPNDPLFFLHHAQVDRLWALWQLRHPDAQHYVGSSVQGHGASHNMWPWNASASAPKSATVRALVPTLASTDVVKPEDLLDTRELGYIYDGEDTLREVRQTGRVVGDNWHTVRLRSIYRKPRQAHLSPVVAGVHTFHGPDTAGVRVRVPDDDPVGRVSFMVEEERSRDEEIGHVEESIAYVAGEEGLIYDASGRVIGELGHIHMDQRNREGRERLLYGHEHGHLDPVVIATISSYVGDQPAHMRLEGVGQYGCDVFIEEWTYLDHYHMREDVSYLVVARGEHRLRDGALVKAGHASVGHSWRTIQFQGDLAFSNAPIVFTMSQTLTRPTPVVTRQQNIGRTSFDVRLQTEERLGAPDEQEWVGWIAFGG